MYMRIRERERVVNLKERPCSKQGRSCEHIIYKKKYRELIMPLIIIILLGQQKRRKKILHVAKNTDNDIRPVFYLLRKHQKIIASLFSLYVLLNN